MFSYFSILYPLVALEGQSNGMISLSNLLKIGGKSFSNLLNPLHMLFLLKGKLFLPLSKE